MKTLITLLAICMLGAHSTGCSPASVDAQTSGSAEAPLSNGGLPIGNVYLAIGGKSGDIEGDVMEQEHVGWVRVLGWRHAMQTALDTTGAPSGKRQHAPIVIEKRVDKSSPQLTQAFVNNEMLHEWTMEVTREAGTGTEAPFYTITLDDAVITGIETTTEYGVLIERVSFAYSRITWTHSDTQVQASDSLTVGK